MSDGSIHIDSGIDHKQFEKDLSEIEKKMKNTSKKMGDWGKNLTKKVTLPIAGLFTAFAKSAMDLEATEAKYNTVFEGMTDTSDEFIQEFQKLTPATTAEARSMASGLQDLLIPMGFMRDDATELTGDFMHLIGALANFNSATHSAEDVTNAFQSALTGQFEPLKRLGINTSKAEVEQRALEMGLADSTDELNDQHLALALQEIATEASSDALAAYNEENLDLKTKVGLAKAEIVDMAAEMGEHLMPMIESAIEHLRRIVDWFGQLTEEQQKNILMVMAVVAAIGPLLLVGSKLIDSLLGIKKAFFFLTSPIGLVVVAVGILIAIVVYLWHTNEEFREAAMEIWQNIQETITTAIGIAKEVIRTVLEFLRDFWNEWGEDIMELVATVFMTVIDIATTVIKNVRDIISTVLDWIKAFWDKWGEDILNFVITTFTSIKTNVKLAIELVQAIIELVLGRIEAFWDRWGGRIQAAWAVLWDLVSGLTETAFGLIQSVISSALGIIEGVFDTFIGLVTGDWERMWEGMQKVVKSVANGIIGLVNGIIGAIESMVNAIGTGIGRIPSIDIPSWVPGLGGKSFGIPKPPRLNIPRIPQLDVGTDRVLADGLAMIHKGEEVVPAKTSGPHSGENEGNGDINIEIANLTVREEADVEKIARKLYQLQQRRGRSVAGAY